MGCHLWGRTESDTTEATQQQQQQSHQTGYLQTADQLYQRNSHTVEKVLGPTTWGSGKGTEAPRELDFGGQWDLITELPQNWGNRLSGGHKQNLVHTRTQEKGAVTTQETEPDLPMSVQESPAEAWVNSSLLRGQGHCIKQCMKKSFRRRLPSPPLPLL